MVQTAALRLLSPSSQDTKLVRLVAAFSGSLDKLDVQEDSRELQLILQSGQTLTGSNTICKYLAKSGSKATDLLGSNPEEEALIAQWLSSRYSLLSPISEEALQKLDDELLTRTFLLGTSLTLADLVLFGVLHPALVSFPSAQVGRHKNIVRWYDYLQHKADAHNIYPKVAFKKPPLNLQPPVVAPAKAKGAEGAGSASKPADAGKPAAAAKAASPANGPASSTTAAASSSAKPSAAPDGASKEAAPAKKSKEAKKEGPESGTAAPAGKDAEARIDQLDIRVGKIVKVDRHPNADSLYVEEIDLGEEQPRQIVSGLVKFVPVEEMQQRKVVVLCNLKPAKMRDVLSSGMVLCASNATHDRVDPIVPPPDAQIGERIKFEGFDGQPDAQLNPRKKIFEKLAPDLLTNADGVAVYKSIPFMTSKGPVTASIPNATVK
ncbi:probable aminoacyl tRNA synthase complex-interacting multifunctional protein at C-terminar half [Coccomyxa sp. Obi]|nr:probable aminoacyl tRNA synthase complex-interacting multifunctional protein at C-terminar half [Coccomyxa sp. Obi]